MADIDGGNGFFSMEMPDIQGFIKTLDLMDKNINKAVRVGLYKGAEIICKEQKRLAPYPFLKEAITVGKIKLLNPYTRIQRTNTHDMVMHNPATKRTYSGVLAITIGYHEDAFNYEQTKNHDYRTYTVSRQGIVHDGDYWKNASKEKPGVIGLTYEFGRPGKSTQHHRNSETMKQIRKRIPNKETAKRKDWQKAVPTEVTIHKGAIQPHPHIRLGFDNKVQQAAQTVIDTVSAAIDKLGDT